MIFKIITFKISRDFLIENSNGEIINYYFLIINWIQLAFFPAVAKVNHQANKQPNGEIQPVPHAQFGHHVKARYQAQ